MRYGLDELELRAYSPKLAQPDTPAVASPTPPSTRMTPTPNKSDRPERIIKNSSPGCYEQAIYTVQRNVFVQFLLKISRKKTEASVKKIYLN